MSQRKQADRGCDTLRAHPHSGSLQLLQGSAFALAPDNKELHHTARGRQHAGDAAMTLLQAAGQLDAHSQVSR